MASTFVRHLQSLLHKRFAHCDLSLSVIFTRLTKKKNDNTNLNAQRVLLNAQKIHMHCTCTDNSARLRVDNKDLHIMRQWNTSK